MGTFSSRLAAALLLLLAPATVSQLDYDLIEVNDLGHPNDPGVDFTFQTTQPGPEEVGGVAAADFNKDGYVDLYFPNSEGFASHLYVNQQDGTFSEAAVLHGVDEPGKRRATAAFFDYDNDGDLDLLTIGYPGVEDDNSDMFTMFRNDGAPGYLFTDVTVSAGGFALAATIESTLDTLPAGVSVADYDRDGHLDFIATWFRQFLGDSAADQPRLFHNVPNPTPPANGQTDYSPRIFVDASIDAGLDVPSGGLYWMPTLFDVNRDGYPDLHFNIEFGEDVLRLNNGDGTFGPDIGTASGLNPNGPSFGNEMGIGLGDIDNDSDFDFLVTNTGSDGISTDVFYRNDTDLSVGGTGVGYSDVSATTGADLVPGVGWGAVFADLDNDADLDMVRARGLRFAAANSVLENLYPTLAPDGVTPAFADVSAQVPQFARLLPVEQDIMRGLAAVDYDNDGDLDLVASRTGVDPDVEVTPKIAAGVFLNTLNNGNNWTGIDLREAGGSLNVVGTRVWVHAGGVTQVREVIVGDSFLTQNPYKLHFGLGSASTDWVAIRWLDGDHTVLAANPPLNTTARIFHGGVNRTGDLDASGGVDCDDVTLFELGLVDPAAVDLAQPDWPWRIVGDIDGNEILDDRDLGQLGQLMPEPWCPLGGAVGGALGAPTLDGFGSLEEGTPVSVQLANAQPFGLTWVLIGLEEVSVPLNGGTLITDPIAVVGPVPASATGTLDLAGSTPAGLLAGQRLYLQFWVEDVTAPFGFAGTNGLKGIAP